MTFASLPLSQADRHDVGQPSLVQRVVARAVALAAGAGGTVVLAGMVVTGVLRGRQGRMGGGTPATPEGLSEEKREDSPAREG